MYIEHVDGPVDYMGPILAKLDRADDHLKTIRSQYRKLAIEQPHRFKVTSSPDFKHRAVSVVFKKPLPLQRWNLLLSEAIHHLRSALDQTVFAIGVREANSLFPPGERALMFPVAHVTDTAANWKKIKWHITSLSEDAQAAIEREQFSPDHKSLFIVDRLSNADKHRSAGIAATLAKNGTYKIGGAPEGGLRVSQGWLHGALNPDTPFLVLDFDRPAPNVKVDGIAITIEREPGIEVLDPKNPGGRGYLRFSQLEVQCRNAVRAVVDRLAIAGKLH